jgi:hypothetical protein
MSSLLELPWQKGSFSKQGRTAKNLRISNAENGRDTGKKETGFRVESLLTRSKQRQLHRNGLMCLYKRLYVQSFEKHKEHELKVTATYSLTSFWCFKFFRGLSQSLVF